MNHPLPSFAIVVLSQIAVCVLGCGGGNLQVGAAWNPDDAPFFDDGADLIENPTILAGTWGGRQKNWMEGRVQLADVVAIVEIQAVQTDIEADTTRGKQIDVRVIQKLYGDPPGDRLSLKSAVSSPGYELIVRYEKRLTGTFILFYRDFPVEEKRGKTSVGHHFHLSPASPALTEYVKQRLALRIDAENG